MIQRVRINAYQVGLVFSKAEYKRVLQPGKYWLNWNEKVKIYSTTMPFNAPVELNILLADPQFAELVNVVDVHDDQIAVVKADQRFLKVLQPGKYAFWKGVVEYDFQILDFTELEVPKNFKGEISKRAEILRYMRIFTVNAFQKGLLLIDGKFDKVLDEGVYRFWQNDTTVQVLVEDMRVRQLEIAGQELLTKDKAALRLNFIAQFQVVNLLKAVIENNDFEKQLYVAFQLALREFVGTLNLDELLANKEAIADYVVKTIDVKAKQLGVEVKGAGVRDVILPGDMKDIMNQVLVAEKQAQANTILRREETAATRSLLNTAKLMENNPTLFKLKQMEYVEKIADKIGEITVNGNNQIVDQLTDILIGK